MEEAGFIAEPGRRTPIGGSYDVIVCGGGPAGACAAIRAARDGARVLLLERQGALGGTWTQGYMTWLMDMDNKGGLLTEIIERLKGMGSLYGRKAEDHSFHVEDMKYLLERMAQGAGVHILYQTLAVAAVTKREETGRKVIQGVITESKSGRTAYPARIVVDATGDGDVAAAAGCGYDMGSPESGEVQPMSLIALVAGLREEAAGNFCLNNEGRPGEAQEKLGRLFRENHISISYPMPVLTHLKGGLYSISLNHEYGVSCDDAGAMTRAQIHAREEILRSLSQLAGAEEDWKDLFIVQTAPCIGVREGRRIHGRYRVTAEDMRAGRQFEDGICEVTLPADIHGRWDEEGKAWEDGGITIKPYQIPLRALIAADVSNLLLAGRLISGDYYAHASYRVGGNIAAIGEAAGVLAALSACSGKRPEEIPYSEVCVRLPL